MAIWQGVAQDKSATTSNPTFVLITFDEKGIKDVEDQSWHFQIYFSNIHQSN